MKKERNEWDEKLRELAEIGRNARLQTVEKKIKKTQAALGIAEVKITNLEKLQGTYKSVPGISTDVGGLKERMDVVVGGLKGRIEKVEKLGDRMSDLEKLMIR